MFFYPENVGLPAYTSYKSKDEVEAVEESIKLTYKILIKWRSEQPEL